MLLNELFLEVGDFCHNNKSLQYLPYILVILIELENFKNVNESIPFEIFCLLISLLGIIIRIYTIAYRPQKMQSDKLNTNGIYSIVRNPLYLGNFFIFFGITLMSQSWEIVITNSLLMIIFYSLVVLYEEKNMLDRFGAEYSEWAQRVNCFIPSFKTYHKPDRKFSLKNVISHEHDIWFLVTLCFVGLEVIRGYFEVNKFFLISMWAVLLSIVFVFWIACKFLKYKKIL